MRTFNSGSSFCLLGHEETRCAEVAVVAAGTALSDLMERVGRAVAEEAMALGGIGRAVILAGPGNNGGDGWVAARHLMSAGIDVAVMSMVDRSLLKGDAAIMAERYRGPVFPFEPESLAGADIVIDALFGTGLNRPLNGAAASIVDTVNDMAARCISVDIPSGISADSGQILGCAVKADLTVTFFRKKPGHLLLPGRLRTGKLVVGEADIPTHILEGIGPRYFENHPDLWRDFWPSFAVDGHKYHRGHVLVAGSRPPALGASRMVARAALRAGAGLVTLAASFDSYPIQATALDEVMVAPYGDIAGLSALMADNRYSVLAIGPGAGICEDTRQATLAALATGKPVVVDADALTAFAGQAERLLSAVEGPVVMTPHSGEFRRLFGEDEASDKLTRTQRASSQSGAVILHKGPDTVIAPPDGPTVIDAHAPPHLATAGAGDVLTGIIAGLLAQKMPSVAAAAAAVWMHGDVARRYGRGMIAGDLLAGLPQVLKELDSSFGTAPGVPDGSV